MLSVEWDDVAFIISWSLMLFYEVFIKSPKQTSRQDVQPIPKHANLLDNGTPQGNADRTSHKDTTTQNSQSTEKARPKDTTEEVSHSAQTARPKDKHEHSAIPSSRSKAKIVLPAQSDHGPGTTHTKSKKGKKSKPKAVEISPAPTTGLKSKPKAVEISPASTTGLKSKPKAVEICPASTTGLKSKSNADNKINKRSKSVANVRAFRETSKERNVKNSKSKKRSRSTSPSPLPRRPPTKLYESTTSSSEPDDKKLDLHGYTVDEAIHAFAQFYLKTEEIYRLKRCEEEDRYIYIVTGRGNGCRDDTTGSMTVGWSRLTSVNWTKRKRRRRKTQSRPKGVIKRQKEKTRKRKGETETRRRNQTCTPSCTKKV